MSFSNADLSFSDFVWSISALLLEKDFTNLFFYDMLTLQKVCGGDLYGTEI